MWYKIISLAVILEVIYTESAICLEIITIIIMT